MHKKMTTVNQQDRYRGCLFGLATGDALGTTKEFEKPNESPYLRDIIGGGPFNLNAGEWTDDTSMALCLADSLIKKQTFDAFDQMERYVLWRDSGYLSSNGVCFDIGNTTDEALMLFKQFKLPYSGSCDANSAGNGSIMRLAAIPMFYFSNPIKAMKYAEKSSATTHGAKACLDACRLMTGIIIGAFNGESKETLLSEGYAPIKSYFKTNPLCKEINEISQGGYKYKKPPEIIGSGYVVKTLEIALWAFYKSNNFEEGMLLVVNEANDADTTGAVYGQIAGAYYGYNAIPESWKKKIALKNLILDFSDKIYKLACLK